jgi:hypothetical protein
MARKFLAIERKYYFMKFHFKGVAVLALGIVLLGSISAYAATANRQLDNHTPTEMICVIVSLATRPHRSLDQNRRGWRE